MTEESFRHAAERVGELEDKDSRRLTDWGKVYKGARSLGLWRISAAFRKYFEGKPRGPGSPTLESEFSGIPIPDEIIEKVARDSIHNIGVEYRKSGND